jgi:flavin reductase (DIM6/NTAB) family NADH-FMN oxidoreductase RutF
MTAIHSYDPRTGHGLKHDPLNAIVAPRPIGWISTVSAAGVRNLAPYSFFNAFNYRPPIIGFSSTGWKDSVRNIEETGQFVWNLATRPLAQAVNATSAMVPDHVDEFALAGLTAAPSQRVAPPRVAESPVAFECRLTQMIRLTDAEGAPVDAWLTLGEVVMVHIDQSAAGRRRLRHRGRRTDPARRRARPTISGSTRRGSSRCIGRPDRR